MNGRWIEFFEGENHRLASRNLTVIISIVVGSFAVIYTAIAGTLSSEVFAFYLLAGGGVYSFGKWIEAGIRKAQIAADSPESVPAPPSTNVTINQPSNANVSN